MITKLSFACWLLLFAAAAASDPRSPSAAADGSAAGAHRLRRRRLRRHRDLTGEAEKYDALLAVAEESDNSARVDGAAWEEDAGRTPPPTSLPTPASDLSQGPSSSPTPVPTPDPSLGPTGRPTTADPSTVSAADLGVPRVHFDRR